jgi:hypothetical protein
MSTLTANYIDCLQGSAEWFSCPPRMRYILAYSRLSSPSASGSRLAKKQKKWLAA